MATKTSNKSTKKGINSKSTRNRSVSSRNTNTKKTSPSKKNTKGKKKGKNKKGNFDVKKEVMIITSVIMSIFLAFSMYFGQGGIIGMWIRNGLYGLFGITAFILPVYILLITFIFVFNKGNNDCINKIILGFFLIVSISTFVHIIYIDSGQIFDEINDESTFLPALSTYYKLAEEYKLTGGLIGGFLGDILVMVIDKFGSLLIMILVMASLVVVIFETSIIALFVFIYKGLKTLTIKIYEFVREIIVAQKEEKDKLREKSKEEKYEKDDFELLTIKKEEKKSKKRNFLDKSKVDEERERAFPETSKEENQDLATVTNLNDKRKTKKEVEDEIPVETPTQISLFNNKKTTVEEKVQTINTIDSEINNANEKISRGLYEYPPLDLLNDLPDNFGSTDKYELRQNAKKLEDTLKSFGVGAKVVNISNGPTVTRYELQPEVGVKVSRIVNLTDDIALNLAATGIRIEAPIPGKALIGIEVPNKVVTSVYIKEVVANEKFMKFPSKVAFAVGKDISGDTIIADIARMPHMLISGATGSGKSVCINTLITSILFRANPEEVKLLMIDPKVVELKVYNGIPHLLIPVVTDAKKAAGALYWGVREMEERYQLFAAANVRDLVGYNKAVEEKGEGKKLPQIVIIVDELADLMQVAAKDVEEAICRLAQMARAAGIHLILATQRPSVDVITGVIKANIPSRIAFAVSSGIDSRTIIDMNGAEKLVGKGDMLYYPSGMNKPLRVQGAFISDQEVENIVNFLMSTEKAQYDDTIIEQINATKGSSGGGKGDSADDVDEHFENALQLVIEKQKASASMIQRKFKVGYNRAARIVDQLFEAGYIGDEEGSKPRKVLYTVEEFYQMREKERLEDAQGSNDSENV